ncbi:sensor histidine kinase [Amycolatopsis sp. NPDC059027]|uniref:sensor histidine kinase n=1 Tax=Amycolatopsis sp. NPDC059027 TaxID=3346709 RepID=UPI00366EC700
MTGVKVDWRAPLWPPEHRTEAPTGWRPWLALVERYLPYVLLAVPTGLSIGLGGHEPPWVLTTTGLVAASLVWVLLTVTLPPERWQQNPVFAVVAFSGFVTLAGILEARDTNFLIFMIFGFFQAMRLRPTPLALAGVAVVSLLIQTLPNGGTWHALTTAPGIWLTVVLVQTAAIGGGAVISATIARQNEERRRMLDQLTAAAEENAGLHRQLLSQAREAGVLDERQRLSQEIHDTLAQGFTGIITQLEAAAQAKEDPGKWQRHLATATTLARENLTAARRSVHALHPEPLESATLPEALEEVSRQWSERTGVATSFTATGTAQVLHPELEATLLRITQEALSNVDKHAAAGRVGLTLSYMEDEVTLDVRDDGTGFVPCPASRPSEAESGFGLPGMRRRVQRLAGTLHVESEPGGGTAISVSLPAIGVQPVAGAEEGRG